MNLKKYKQIYCKKEILKDLDIIKNSINDSKATNRIIEINGKKIQYTVYKIPKGPKQGSINIGRIHEKIRLITTDELRLLNQILKNVYQSRKDRFFYVYEVVTLNDGGMGSFCFYYNNGVDPGKLEDKVYAIGEIEFFDIDNVGCLATLYAYNDNRVAELDIWKYDFSQLKQIPKYF